MSKVRSDYDAQVARLRDEIQAQADRFKEQIRIVKQEQEEEHAWLVAEKEKAIKNAESKFQSEQLEAMQAQSVAHKSVVDSLHRQFDMEKTRMMEEGNRKHSFEIAELRDSLAKKHLSELEQASRFHDTQTQALKSELEKVIEMTRQQEQDYEARIEEQRRQLKQREVKVAHLEDQVHSMEQKMNGLVGEIDALKVENSRAREQMITEMRTREEEAVANIERELDQARRDARFQQQALVEEFSKAQQILKEKLVNLQEINAELEERYRNRESRDEDLQMIEELKDRLRNKAMELNQAIGEKKILEKELVNREQNFNKIFSSNPQVGVINPINATKHGGKRPSVDTGSKGSLRTNSGGSVVGGGAELGQFSVMNSKGKSSSLSSSHQSGSVVAKQQAWGSPHNSSQAQQRMLDPLPHSPIHDEPFNPLKPLPPPKLTPNMKVS